MASEQYYRKSASLNRLRINEYLEQLFPDQELPKFLDRSRYGVASVESENWRVMADFLATAVGQPETVETVEGVDGEPENVEVETVELENGEEVTGESAEESSNSDLYADGDYEANYITGFVSDPVDNAFGFIEEDEEQSDPDENATPVDEMTRADFEEFFKSEGIEVEGTGSNGYITVDDYRKAFNAL